MRRMQNVRVQWLLAAGAEWVPLDPVANQQIEQWWFNHTRGYLRIRAFGGSPVYVDAANLTVRYGSLDYRIARQLQSVWS
jgi:hypothetical protein